MEAAVGSAGGSTGSAKRGDAFCIRWKGFHGNMVHSLETMQTDEDFVDVTLATCDGGAPALRAHRLVLASCSPYFGRILRENAPACSHPIIVLDVASDVLAAIVTYMYQGEVFVPESLLQTFLRTAASLEIKGIADDHVFHARHQHHHMDAQPHLDGSFGVRPPPSQAPASAAAASASSSTPAPSQPQQKHQHHHPHHLPHLLQDPLVHHRVRQEQHQHQLRHHHEEQLHSEQQQQQLHSAQHPVGDLYILAKAAASTQPQPRFSSSSASAASDLGSMAKRRKTMPRRLDVSLPFVDNTKAHSAPEITSAFVPFSDSAINLSMKKEELEPEAEPQPVLPRLVIPKPDLSLALDMSSPTAASTVTSSGRHMSLSSPKSPVSESSSSSASEANNEKENEDTEAAIAVTTTKASVPPPVTDSTTAEQFSALLGPSWKSRQPRMCQYCQRMFSNKFNLKQHILNMHTVGRELHCELCQKKVKNKWYLRRHHVTHHGAPLKK